MSRARSICLFVEAILFTILVPGTVTVWLPAVILSPAERVLPNSWTPAQVLAVILITSGAAVYFRCLWEFATRGRGIPAPVDHPKELVVTGLYRYVRNPMYVGVLTLLAGEAVLFQSQRWLFFTIGFFVFVNLFVILYEERYLRYRFGASYARYTSAVRRWIPGPRYGGTGI